MMYIIHILKSSSFKYFVFIALGLSHQSMSTAQSLNTTGKIDYSLWNNLLQKHVNEKGQVDYQGFTKDKSDLKLFTDQLSKNTPWESWTKNGKKAYLINLYNAFTIQLIIENYPLNSIKEIGDKPFDAFKKEFINFGGEMVSLDDIEKGMLIPMGDPRVHFAVNCASYSCPRLYNKAYTPQQLDEQLEKAATRFINSELNVITKNEVKLSKLFDWYKSDFETKSQPLIDFISRYSRTKIDQDTQLEFLEYDWSLNSK